VSRGESAGLRATAGSLCSAVVGERYAVAALLALATVLSRLPFRAQFLYHWDSVNFANAMQHFDVLQEHPQPPGYIVYVWLSRAVSLLAGEPNETMVWISVVAGGLAVGCLYVLGATMWNSRTGLVAAALLACSPLFWFYSEIALPHALDAFLVLLAVLLLYRVQSGEHGPLLPATVVLAVIGGVRQQTLVFLLPLTVLAVRRSPWRRVATMGVLGTALCLGWFIPLILSVGGLGAYLDKLSTFSERFQTDTSLLLGAGWPGLARNASKLTRYTLYAWHMAMIAPLAALACRKEVLRRMLPLGKVIFLAVWILPALAFYLVIHMGQQGLVLPVLPALCLLTAVGLEAIASGARRPGRALAICATPVVLAGALVFLLMPEYPLDPDGQRLLTRQTLVNSDRYYRERIATIRERWAPSEALVVAENWVHAEYYLPEYRVMAWDASLPVSQQCAKVASESQPATPGALPGTVVLFDARMHWPCDTARRLDEISLASGGSIRYLVPSAGSASTGQTDSRLALDW